MAVERPTTLAPERGPRAAGLGDRAQTASLGTQHPRATPGYYRRAWQRFRRDKVAFASLVLVVLVIAFVLAAPLIAYYISGQDYRAGALGNQLKPPFTDGHLLGTDANGRDVLTRLAYGGRISMLVAGLATATILLIGGAVGSISGYYGGTIDATLMRTVDVLLTIPFLPLLILVSAIYKPGPIGFALILALVGWAGVARLIRGQVLSLRHQDYVEAARVIGASNSRIITRHIVPHVIPIVVVWASLAIPSLILTEAALSFLGFGVQIPTPTWGNMLQGAKDFYTRSWTNVFIPGFTIYITVLAISLVGKGLRDALDPRLNE
jgi:ABC-type dipeptide/oligopeptide/nickel transport system permease subunit